MKNPRFLKCLMPVLPAAALAIPARAAPEAKATEGKWLDCEKKLYQQLISGEFPGKEQAGEKSDRYNAYSRKAATVVVPEALAAGFGLYGSTAPRKNTGIVPLEGILSRPVAELKGDDRNIAVLARAYHGASLDAVWDGRDGFTKTPN